MNEDMFLPNPFPPFHNESGKSGDKSQLTAWGYLAVGNTLGKRVNQVYTGAVSAGSAQSAPMAMLAVSADDKCAHSMVLTLAPPEVYEDLAPPLPDDIQNLSGSYDNITRQPVFPAGAVGGRVTATLGRVAMGNPVAIIEWGIGGVASRVEADFSNGLCLNLQASFVRVRSFFDSVILGTAETAHYQTAAFIGPGHAKPMNAQRTVMMTDATAINTESAMYTVPRFAKSVHLCGANDVHDTFVGTIRFYRSNDAAAAGAVVADYIFAGNTAGPIPIPNGAYYFTFVPGIADCFACNAVFQLAV